MIFYSIDYDVSAVEGPSNIAIATAAADGGSLPWLA